MWTEARMTQSDYNSLHEIMEQVNYYIKSQQDVQTGVIEYAINFNYTGH